MSDLISRLLPWPMCNRSAIRGGAGVDDASGVFIWWCSRAVNHADNCTFDRPIGQR